MILYDGAYFRTNFSAEIYFYNISVEQHEDRVMFCQRSWFSDCFAYKQIGLLYCLPRSESSSKTSSLSFTEILMTLGSFLACKLMTVL